MNIANPCIKDLPPPRGACSQAHAEDLWPGAQGLHSIAFAGNLPKPPCCTNGPVVQFRVWARVEIWKLPGTRLPSASCNERPLSDAIERRGAIPR